MAALAEAADYAPASLYTYFPSRSALLAALQQRALATLAEVGRSQLGSWVADVPAAELALARLWAFSDLFLAAPREQAREFRLQQQLFMSVGAEETGDAATVVPAAMAVLDLPRRLIADAVAAGVLTPHVGAVDPLLDPVDGDLLRTLAWVVALNGALLADRLTTGMPTTGTALGEQITESLLAGWGAPAELGGPARALAATWRRPHQRRGRGADRTSRTERRRTRT